MKKIGLTFAVLMAMACAANANPDEKYAQENVSHLAKALSVEAQARNKVIDKDGDGLWGLHSMELTDSVALDIHGNVLAKTFGSAGFVRLIFENGLRRCAITIQTRRDLIMSDNVTCTGERP